MYLFFVRHFNDIDHIAPIVWKITKENHPAAVFCMNLRYNIWSDYRLQFLKDIGVTVNYLYDEFGQYQNGFYRTLYFLMNQCFTFQRTQIERNNKQRSIPFHLFIGLIGSLGTLLYKILRMGYFGVNWARKIIEYSGAQAICFDHIMPGLYVVDAFLRAAKELSIPTLTLPHGVHLYTNEVTKPKATSARRLLKFNSFDYVIAPNQLRKNMLTQSGVSADKIFVLGSARYCDEWMEQNRKILPKRFGNSKNKINKLKLVFLPSKPQCNVDRERMTKTLELLADNDDIEVMIKPHTRTSDNIDLSIGKNLRNASDVLTADLCEWADAILIVGSSVITEALMKKKPALYLKYLHSNTTLFEELHACWTIRNESELNTAILSLCENKISIPYSQENVKNYIVEVVYGGTEDKDVLAKYENFIVDYASKALISRP